MREKTFEDIVARIGIVRAVVKHFNAMPREIYSKILSNCHLEGILEESRRVGNEEVANFAFELLCERAANENEVALTLYKSVQIMRAERQ